MRILLSRIMSFFDYDGKFEEVPYPGKGYRPQEKPRATFAAMVTRLDRDVQRVIDLLADKGVLDNTIIIFTSDNGTHKEGGHDPRYFDSNGPFRGMKRDLYEGGIRTPFYCEMAGSDSCRKCFFPGFCFLGFYADNV